MRTVVLAAVALVIVGGLAALLVLFQGRTEAQDTIAVDIRAYAMTSNDKADGAECFPWGVFDFTLDEEPFRQVIVTDAGGTIVAAVDLQVGEIEDTSCNIRETVILEPSPFYTFAVDGKYRRTISAGDLAGMGEVAIHLLP